MANKIFIDTKPYIVGLDWYAFGEKTKIKNIISKNKYYKIYRQKQYYIIGISDIPIAGEVLAEYFLDVAPGIYRFRLEDEGKIWLLVKGTDGGILLDRYGHEEDIRDKHSIDLEHYSVILNSYELSYQDLAEKLKKKTKRGINFSEFYVDEEKRKKLLIGIVAVVVILVGLQFISKKMKKETVLEPSVITPAPSQVVEPEPIQQQAPIQHIGYKTLNLEECYNNFYSQATKSIDKEIEITCISQDTQEKQNIKCSQIKENVAKYGVLMDNAILSHQDSDTGMKISISGFITQDIAKQILSSDIPYTEVSAKVRGSSKRIYLEVVGEVVCSRE